MIFVSAYDYPEPIRTIMMISQITNGIGLFLIALFAFIYYRKEGFFENEQTKTYIVGIVILFSILGVYRFFFSTMTFSRRMISLTFYGESETLFC
ncbi:MAG: hypothetical protein GF311_18085 [Candidatus Lokiarchaeota archaeon]|nr:hypothetical protein [Candidatus Lokiarchaeota archaeon]